MRHNSNAYGITTCASGWDISINQYNISNNNSFVFSFDNSTDLEFSITVKSPSADSYDEPIETNLCLELMRKSDFSNDIIATSSIGINATIEHSWKLEFANQNFEIFKDESTIIYATIYNTGTAEDTFELTVNPLSNSSCLNCVVEISSPVDIGPNSSREVWIEINNSRYDTNLLSFSVKNIDSTYTSCNTNTNQEWCFISVNTVPKDSFISIDSEYDSYYLIPGECADVSIEISLSEIDFVNTLNLSLENFSNLVFTGSSEIYVPPESNASNSTVSLCSLTNDPLNDITNVEFTVSVPNYDRYSASHSVEIIPYRMAVLDFITLDPATLFHTTNLHSE